MPGRGGREGEGDAAGGGAGEHRDRGGGRDRGLRGARLRGRGLARAACDRPVPGKRSGSCRLRSSGSGEEAWLMPPIARLRGRGLARAAYDRPAPGAAGGSGSRGPPCGAGTGRSSSDQERPVGLFLARWTKSRPRPPVHRVSAGESRCGRWPPLFAETRGGRGRLRAAVGKVSDMSWHPSFVGVRLDRCVGLPGNSRSIGARRGAVGVAAESRDGWKRSAGPVG